MTQEESDQDRKTTNKYILCFQKKCIHNQAPLSGGVFASNFFSRILYGHLKLIFILGLLEQFGS